MIREKKRYLLVEIKSDAQYDKMAALKLLQSAVFEFCGSQGAARIGLSLKEFDGEGQRVIVRCALAGYEDLQAALAFKRFFEGKNVALRVAKASGAIGKLL